MAKTRVGVGKSTRRAAFEAGADAAKQAMSQLEGVRPDMVLVFGTTGYDQQDLLDGIVEITGPTPMVGCAGEGVITSDGADEGSHAVSVMAIASDRMSLRAFHVTDASTNVDAAAEKIASFVNDHPAEGAKLLLLFPDGLTLDCPALLRSLDERVRAGVKIAGGTSGSIMESWVTYQYFAGAVHSGSVSALLIGGDVVADLTVSHGCEPIGLERTITRAQTPYVLDVDHQRAIDVMNEYIDGEASTDLHVGDFVQFALCVGVRGRDEDRDQQVIRVPLSVQKETGALYFSGGLAEGTRIRVCHRSRERLRESAIASAHALASRHRERPPVFVIQLDCAGRGRLMFGTDTTEMVVSPMQEVLGRDVPWLGFHTFGEIAPIDRAPHYHNYSVVLCALYEGADDDPSRA